MQAFTKSLDQFRALSVKPLIHRHRHKRARTITKRAVEAVIECWSLELSVNGVVCGGDDYWNKNAASPRSGSVAAHRHGGGGT